MFAGDRVALDLARQLRNDAEQRAADHRLLQSLETEEPLRARILRVVVGG